MKYGMNEYDSKCDAKKEQINRTKITAIIEINQ